MQQGLFKTKKIKIDAVFCVLDLQSLSISLMGVASSIYDPLVRTGFELDLQNAIQQHGGVHAFNKILEQHILEPLPSYSQLAKEARCVFFFSLLQFWPPLLFFFFGSTISQNGICLCRRRRVLLVKYREGLARLMTDCIAVLGNLAPLAALRTRPSSFNVASEASLGRGELPDGGRVVHPDFVADDSETVGDASPNGADEFIDDSCFPPWWNDFNQSVLHRKNLYLTYANSIQRANAVRKAEKERLKQINGVATMVVGLPLLTLLSEDEWFEATRRKVLRQAREKHRRNMQVARDRFSEGTNDESDGSTSSSNDANRIRLAGGSLDNLRPASFRAVTQSLVGMLDGIAELDTEHVTVVHFLNAYLDPDRQGFLPSTSASSPSSCLLQMTRPEFALMYQRCMRLRDVCTVTVDACAQTISRLRTLERVLNS
jgi:hypothetical protein